MTHKKILTLCLIYQPPRLLLGMKKRGFGAGWWNGFGGKVEEGETIEQAARREIAEEAGVTVSELEQRGMLIFEFPHRQEQLEVHVFKVINFEGEPVESEEIKPRWFEVSEIPYENMWPDDKYWLPIFLEEKKFRGTVVFDEKNDIISNTIAETVELVIEEKLM